MNAIATASRPRWLSVVGILGVIAMGFTVWLGLWVTPPDAVQGNLARLLYIHPPIATVALYWAGGVALAGSLLYLWPRTRSFFWDRLAASAVEVGAVFSALTCITGSIWGRPAWGVWWAWDARLTSTALLLLLELGYLALRRVPADPAVRARRCAVAALLIAVDVPIVHFSVVWWQTLHQSGTVLDPGFHLHVHGSMAWTFLLGFIAFSLIFVWLLGVRYQIEVLQDRVGDQEMEVSLAERWRRGQRAHRASGRAHPGAPGRGRANELRRRRVHRRPGHRCSSTASASCCAAGAGRRALKVPTDSRRAGGPRRTVVTSTLNEPNSSPGLLDGHGHRGPGAAPSRAPHAASGCGSSSPCWLAAFVFLLVEGLGSSLNYFDTVDQAFAHRATLGTRTFNLEGDVVAGSIHPTAVGTDFTISEGSAHAWPSSTPAARRSSSRSASPSSWSVTSRPPPRTSSCPTRSWSSTRRTTAPPTPAG